MHNEREIAVNCGRLKTVTENNLNVFKSVKKTASGERFGKSEFTAAIPGCLSTARLE